MGTEEGGQKAAQDCLHYYNHYGYNQGNKSSCTEYRSSAICAQ
ncbi:unnamed protein product [Haemonchus placei]|uniref:Uncharacterized protein n=1 Tax=Haemonchus placei TaxID=6290 RepID=A0A3P7UAQ6_HAEPC|nr:unnamed protein product [Haemonchus placei]